MCQSMWTFKDEHDGHTVDHVGVHLRLLEREIQLVARLFHGDVDDTTGFVK